MLGLARSVVAKPKVMRNMLPCFVANFAVTNAHKLEPQCSAIGREQVCVLSQMIITAQRDQVGDMRLRADEVVSQKNNLPESKSFQVFSRRSEL